MPVTRSRRSDYVRKVTILDAGWGPLAFAAGLVLVAAAVAGILLGSRPWLVVASFAVAISLAVLVLDMEDNDRLQWPGRAGVIGYESPHGGPLLQPVLDDLKAKAKRSPEARDPGWTLSGEDYTRDVGSAPGGSSSGRHSCSRG